MTKNGWEIIAGFDDKWKYRARQDTTFHLFTLLPSEIQLLVFELATETWMQYELPHDIGYKKPYGIYLRVDKGRSKFQRYGPWEDYLEERKHFDPLVTTLPPLLYVSRMSRQVAYDTLTRTVFDEDKGEYFYNWHYGRDIDIYVEYREEDDFPDDYRLRVEDFRLHGCKERVEEEKRMIEEAKSQEVQTVVEKVDGKLVWVQTGNEGERNRHPRMFTLVEEDKGTVYEWPKTSVGFLPRPRAALPESSGAKRENSGGENKNGNVSQSKEASAASSIRPRFGSIAPVEEHCRPGSTSWKKCLRPGCGLVSLASQDDS